MIPQLHCCPAAEVRNKPEIKFWVSQNLKFRIWFFSTHPGDKDEVPHGGVTFRHCVDNG